MPLRLLPHSVAVRQFATSRAPSPPAHPAAGVVIGGSAHAPQSGQASVPVTAPGAAGAGGAGAEDELSQPFVVEGTRANFEKEVLQSKRPVIVDFYADWCVV